MARPGVRFSASLLLHFVFCLSPCRVNICYLNECCLPVLEVLHFALYFGSWEENLRSVRWPGAPSSRWDHRVAWVEKESICEDAPYRPVFTAFSIWIFMLLLKVTSTPSCVPALCRAPRGWAHTGEAVQCGQRQPPSQNSPCPLQGLPRDYSSRHPLWGGVLQG